MTAHLHGIAGKLIKALILFSSVITLVTTGIQLYAEYDRDMDAIQTGFTQIERSYLGSIAENVWQIDVDRLQLQVSGILEFTDFLHARIVDENGQPLAEAGAVADEQTLDRVYPLYYTLRGTAVEIGTLNVAVSMTSVYGRALDRVGLMLVSNGVRTFFVAGFLFVLVSWLITRHLHSVAEATRNVDFNDKPEPVSVDRGRVLNKPDELDQLIAAFNDMQAKLFDSYEALRSSHGDLEVKVSEGTDALRILSSAIQQNPSMVFITDSEGNIEYVNDMFLVMTQYDASEVVGRNPRILKSTDTPARINAELWRTIKSGKVWRGELKDLRKDGSFFWAQTTIAPIHDETGDITHFVSIHEDITARKAEQIALENATARAEVANQAKSELLANMSHELRTPLNAIIGFSEAMRVEAFGPINNPKYETYISDIHTSGEHLLGLINDVLDVSAIEAGKLQLTLSDVDLADVCDTSLRMLANRAEQAGIELVSDIHLETPVIRADERRLIQVLLNLLSNAIKFSPEGNTVTLDARTTPENEIRIAVVDTGIGMDEVGMETALSQFGQVDSRLARKYEGTGLGLPLSKKLVETMGGTLEIDSHLGEGTTVTVTLPRDGDQLQQAQDG